MGGGGVGVGGGGGGGAEDVGGGDGGGGGEVVGAAMASAVGGGRGRVAYPQSACAMMAGAPPLPHYHASSPARRFWCPCGFRRSEWRWPRAHDRRQ